MVGGDVGLAQVTAWVACGFCNKVPLKLHGSEQQKHCSTVSCRGGSPRRLLASGQSFMSWAFLGWQPPCCQLLARHRRHPPCGSVHTSPSPSLDSGHPPPARPHLSLRTLQRPCFQMRPRSQVLLFNPGRLSRDRGETDGRPDGHRALSLDAGDGEKGPPGSGVGEGMAG